MFRSFFGAQPIDLTQVSAMPGMDMSALNSQPMQNVMARYEIPQQPDYMGMLSAFGGMGDTGSQQAPMMPSPQGPQLQAGGEQFGNPYQFNPWQLQPTAHRLGGLLSGAGYGTV